MRAVVEGISSHGRCIAHSLRDDRQTIEPAPGCDPHADFGAGFLWVIYEAGNGDRMIEGFYIDHHSDGVWTAKGYVEREGMAAVSCPVEFLDRVPTPDDELAVAWRRDVRSYHATPDARPQRAIVDYRGESSDSLEE